MPEQCVASPVRHIGVRDLTQGMDTRVGAAGTLGTHAGAAREFGQGLLQHILHGSAARLALPTAEGGAVVSQRQLKSHGARSSQLCSKICAAT